MHKAAQSGTAKTSQKTFFKHYSIIRVRKRDIRIKYGKLNEINEKEANVEKYVKVKRVDLLPMSYASGLCRL